MYREVIDNLFRMRSILDGRGDFVEQPIRGEYHSLFDLKKLARSSAVGGRARVNVSANSEGRKLLAGLKRNQRIIFFTYKALRKDLKERPFLPVEAWVFDNYNHVLQSSARIIKDFSMTFYSRLPVLDATRVARIYELSYLLVAGSDSSVSVERIASYVEEYQRINYLQTRELWMMPVVLQILLLENIARVAKRVLYERDNRAVVHRWIDHFDDTFLASDVGGLAKGLKRLLIKKPLARDYFLFEVFVHLTRKGLTPLTVNSLISRVSGMGEEGVREMIQKEKLNQRDNEKTIKNAIVSLQGLAKADWAGFVEKLSHLEKILGEDPAGVYQLMDFTTRDFYRHAIEQIGLGAGCDEEEIARKAIDLCRRERSTNAQPYMTHVGYYLIDNGRSKLESSFNFKPTVAERIDRLFSQNPSVTFFGVLVSVLIVTFGLVLYLLATGIDNPPFLLYIGILLASPCLFFAGSVANYFLSKMIHPTCLPRMDPERGVFDRDRTIVTIPTLLVPGSEEPRTFLGHLEISYLANNDRNIFFALVLAFPETISLGVDQRSEEEKSLSLIRRGIDDLNKKYGNKFFLLFRDRVWNEREGKWIEWERKRGKIEMLNKLLRGSTETDLRCLAGDAKLLTSFKYAITADRDLRLPKDSVKLLIATIAHPLNKAVVDEENKRIVRGYGIIQPKLAFSKQEEQNTILSSTMNVSTGWDSYSGILSDIYQDLFNESIYFGKGIYDIDAFRIITQERFPEDLLLSHDFLEGFYVRTGFASDVQVFEGGPTSYFSYISRLHRWIRGDWQVIGWLFPNVPGLGGVSYRNPLRKYQRWRIFENLTRSLSVPSMFLFLISVWLFFPSRSLFADMIVLLLVSFQDGLLLLDSFSTNLDPKLWYFHILSLFGQIRLVAKKLYIQMSLLAVEALVSLDAICKSIFRMMISRRKLLEWKTSYQIEVGSNNSWKAFWLAGIPGLILFLVILFLAPRSLLESAPITVLWILSPLTVNLISKPLLEKGPSISSEEYRELRQMGRRTWRFFQDLVGPGNNFLPPDDFQDSAKPPISPRTSVTNIGFYLLSIISAYDLGLIGSIGVGNRVKEITAVLKKMKRYKGHFFNWYDIRTLKPAASQYVSTVDSGNLAISLLVVKQGLLELCHQKIITPQAVENLEDIVIKIRGLGKEGIQSKANSIEKYLLRLKRDLALKASVIGAHETLVLLLEEASVLAKSQHVRKTGSEELLLNIEELSTSVQREILTLEFFHPWIKQRASQGQMIKYFDDLFIPQEIATRYLELSRDLTKGSGDKVFRLLNSNEKNVHGFIYQCNLLSRELEDLAINMDFSFLYDYKRNLFSVGFSLSKKRFDKAYYDLLASESRLASYFAIAKGDVPLKHWLSLGRPLTAFRGMPALISWGGSMFEYLLPLVFMRNVPDTLLSWTYRTVVEGQKQYGSKYGVPWGISESSFAKRNQDNRYRYELFGVPYFGFKKGLGKPLVIAPYASFLALETNARESYANLLRLRNGGAEGRYGFFESVDFTSKKEETNRKVLVETFLCHHQGMSLTAVADVLSGHKMQQRFMGDKRLNSLSFLLEERLPSSAHTVPGSMLSGLITERSINEPLEIEEKKEYVFPHKSRGPMENLISNGNYRVYISDRGSGFREYGGVDITRRNLDAVDDNVGSFLYLTDSETGKTWSATYQPLLVRPLKYETVVLENQVRIGQMYNGIESQLETTVLGEEDVEIRRLFLKNISNKVRVITVTSYDEVVLSPYPNYRNHPSYERLFLESWPMVQEKAILFFRRNVSGKDRIFLMLKTVAEGSNVAGFKLETSRLRFLGRGRTPSNPLAISAGAAPWDGLRNDLDSIASFRWEIRILPGEQLNIFYLSCVAFSQSDAQALASKYSSELSIVQAVEAAHKQVNRQASIQEVESVQLLLSGLMFGRSSFTWGKYDRSDIASLNNLSLLMGMPLVVIKINQKDQKWDVFFHQFLRCATYLYGKGFRMEVIILLQSTHDVYFETEFKAIQQILASYGLDAMTSERGKMVVLRNETLRRRDLKTIEAYARVVLDSSKKLSFIHQLRASFYKI